MARMPPAPSFTLVDLGTDRLRALCRALRYDEEQARAAEALFRTLGQSWAERRADRPAHWASDITDDHTPFEFSLAIDGDRPELRFLVEVQAKDPSIGSNWSAAQAMNEELARAHGAHLDRFLAVQDLFAPTPRCTRFAMWHAVCFPPSGAPELKIYLNPQARGREEARNVVQTAMDRLGFGVASEALPALGPSDEICYFSLDLAARREARLKVYTAHYHATADRIEAAIRAARGHTPGRVADFCWTVSESLGPYDARPVLTCLSFVQGIAKPTVGTIHFPVRSYVGNDRIALERVMRYLSTEGAELYEHAIDAFADRRLEDGIGMHTYTSLRVEQERRRVTVYLAPEVYNVGQTAITQPAVSGVVDHRGRKSKWPAASGER